MLAPHPLHLSQRKRALRKLDTGVPSGSSSRASLSPTSPASLELNIDDHHTPLKVFSLSSPTSVTSTGKRGLFRLRRPSSSSAAQQPTYKTDLHRLTEDVENPPEAIPPRPQRTSTRKSSAFRRPSTASGAAEHETSKSSRFQRMRSSSVTSPVQTQAPQSPLRGFGPILSVSGRISPCTVVS